MKKRDRTLPQRDTKRRPSSRPGHIVVCVKAVVTKAPAHGTVRSAETAVLNPFDRPALAMALSLAKDWDAEVTTLSMGPESVAFTLFETLAMGATRGILLSDPGLADSDTLATSTALAAALKKLAPFDLVLFGARTSDSDTGQVGPQTAVMCDIPAVIGALSVKKKGALIRVERIIDEFREVYELELPAALTVHSSAPKPPDIPLAGLEDAFGKGRVEFWNLDDLALKSELTGKAGSPTAVLSMSRVVRERKCRFLAGTVEEQAESLLSHIRESGHI